MFIINNRKFFFILSGLLMVGSIVSVAIFGLNFGIDFKGGSLLEVSYQTTRPASETIKADLDTLDLGTYVLTPAGNLNYVLKARDITPTEKTEIMDVFSKDESNLANE